MSENPTQDGGKIVEKEEKQQQPTGPLGITDPQTPGIHGDPPRPAGSQGSY